MFGDEIWSNIDQTLSRSHTLFARVWSNIKHFVHSSMSEPVWPHSTTSTWLCSVTKQCLIVLSRKNPSSSQISRLDRTWRLWLCSNVHVRCVYITWRAINRTNKI